MARKKTPPEYGESDYRAVSICAVAYRGIVVLCTRAGRGDEGRLTGPMMVACQWNYQTHRVSPCTWGSLHLSDEVSCSSRME